MKRRALGAAALATALGGSLLGLVGAGPAVGQPGHQILATGLDNPRQLNWSENGKTLVIAEAGSGGSTCIGEGPEGPTCIGFTGSVGTIAQPWNKVRVAPRVVASGLLSAAAPDGSFATGPDGADLTDVPGEVITAITGLPPEARPPGLPPEVLEQLGKLVVSGTADDGEMFNFGYLDFQTYEERRNPDGAQIDSNPYAILFVASDVGDKSGYALVADAAANTVWKVDPDMSVCGEDDDCVPPAKVTVFATWAPPGGADDDEDIEYVPTSLASDKAGNIYVGGLGSLQPGEGKVTKFSATGKEMRVWSGFTSVTGVAVDKKGALYVSQLFGGAKGNPFEPGAPVSGLLTKVGLAGQSAERFVPFPAGVAVDKHFNVYVSAYSTLPSGFRPGDTTRPSEKGGEIWRVRF